MNDIKTIKKIGLGGTKGNAGRVQESQSTSGVGSANSGGRDGPNDTWERKCKICGPDGVRCMSCQREKKRKTTRVSAGEAEDRKWGGIKVREDEGYVRQGLPGSPGLNSFTGEKLK